MSHSSVIGILKVRRASLAIFMAFALASCSDPYKAYAECISLKNDEIENSISYKSSQTLRCDKPNLRLWPCTTVEKTMWDVANRNIDYQHSQADIACREETGYDG